MTELEKAARQALEALERMPQWQMQKEAITALRRALEQQPAEEPVAYDKTELNCFVQDLYDKKMQEGKHGHYETMFHCVHQAIKKIYTRPQPAAQITNEQIQDLLKCGNPTDEEQRLIRLGYAAAQPVAQWVDLSFEDSEEIIGKAPTVIEAVQMTEAKLRSKNGGDK